MMKEYQVTLICTTGQYKPVSCIIKKDDEELSKVGKEAFLSSLQKEGLSKICNKRYWTTRELKKYGYTKAKIREYDKEKIALENKAKYEQFKEEKYQSGEWKRPKSKEEIKS